MIRIISDVHGAVAALQRLVAEPGPLLILGDLINFIDYRDNSGIVADVAGSAFVADVVRARSRGDFDAARGLWQAHRKGREDQLRADYASAIDSAYAEICAPLREADTTLTYGNVDNVDVMLRHLPETATFVETGTITVAGQTFGIVGGGVPTISSPGEISDEEMAARLESIGSVDVLCTHVAPAVGPLATDVVGGRAKGSPAVREYLKRHQPEYHYFGDIHQPQAVSWMVGRTRCVNVGYFRATGRAVRHHAG